MSKINIDINEKDYDGIIVKRLETSNTLDEGRTTNQRHIAITGSQMDIFPYLRAEGYFQQDYTHKDGELKKYFITQIPIWINKVNLKYLGLNIENEMDSFKGEQTKRVLTSIVRGRRKNQTDQIQMSLINMDSREFIEFRKFLHIGSYLIILKRKQRLEYEAYGMKPDTISQEQSTIHELNNKFYKLPTETTVDISTIQHENLLREDKGVTYNANQQQRVKGGTNVLLYGVPGSGKSYTVTHDYCDDEDRITKLVFHPDYTYSDFVGQILPVVDDEKMVSYVFTPGPFTKILKQSYFNPSEEYFLMIEEINRGNAPAIFGEVFQLLDRDDDGRSEYGITNADIAKEVYGDENHKVRIPSNMSIIGTMNTSDQNVFTLDTAFQRRWNMRMVENDLEKLKSEFANHPILDTTVTWKRFNSVINEIIVIKNTRMTSSEDKRLGVYFIRLKDLEFNADEDKSEDGRIRKKAARENSRFPEKVIKYLWDDAFKFKRDDVFDVTNYNNLEEIVRKFKTARKDDRFAVFKEEVRLALIPKETLN
nr:AAA family ATPase [Clostridium botulinum]